jgi:RND family efflux transporter MFP subunit
LISVYTKASGVVKEVYVTDGQTVNAGDKLAEITLDIQGQTNQSSAWASYLNAQKNVQSAQANQYSQQANMFQEWDDYINLTNDSRFEDPNSQERELVEFTTEELQWLAAEQNYKLQDISISAAHASQSNAWYNYQLYQAIITAPIDGVIVGMNLAPGLTVSYSEGNSGGASTQTVARVQTEGHPVALFNATEVDIPLIQVGQQVTIELDSIVDQSFAGTVSAVDRVGTVTNGVTQYQVLISFEESSKLILPNMAVTAELILEQKDHALVVPTGAVISGPNGDAFVRVMQDGKPRPVPVEIGLETDTYIEIISGIDEDSQVITGTNSSTDQTTTGGNFSSGGFNRPPGGGITGGRPAGAMGVGR